MRKALTAADFQSLANLRHEIRRFLHFSEQASRGAGLEPRQHQVMLAIRGLPANTRPRIGEIARRLQIQHHSAVELVDRMEARGLVRRLRAGADRRRVFVHLTRRGEAVLPQLSHAHRTELRSVAPGLRRALGAFVPIATSPRASAIG